MILNNENSIYIFYELIEQLQPESVLDVGMFLKRVGTVSRKIMGRAIPQECQICGIDFFPEVTFPIWNTVYDRIVSANGYFMQQNIEHFDFVSVLGLKELEEQIPLEKLAARIAQDARYILTDQWDIIWSMQQGFVRVSDIKVEEDVFFLLEFEG